MTRAAITGIAHYYPSTSIDNAELAAKLSLTEGWIRERTGIRRRVVAAANQATSDLIVPAANACLHSASKTPREVDCIIVATVTPDMMFPSTAALVQERIGARNAWGFDLSASSAGFVCALSTANSLIISGSAKCVLVCGGDKMSSITNPDDPGTAILFGDAAGVVLLEPSDGGDLGIIDVVARLDGSGATALQLPAGGSRTPASTETVNAKQHYLIQDGGVIFRAAVTMMSDISNALMFRNSLKPDDVEWLVPHQANLRIIEAVGAHLQIPLQRTMVNLTEIGNTWAASIPACISQWHEKHRLKRGDRLLLASFGGGYTAAGALVRWSLD